MSLTSYALTLLKLAFALAGFLLVAYYGARDKRIVGVLLTFPLLNGIALLSSPDPIIVALANYPLVIINIILFWDILSAVQWVPQEGTELRSPFLLIMRVLLWGFAWATGAYFIMVIQDYVPTGPIWFLAYTGIATVTICVLWQKPNRADPSGDKAPRFWFDWGTRVVLFVLVFLCLAYAAQHASDQKWVGMAGAFPLPGIFAIASLSVTTRAEQLTSIRDTVLLGPILVVPFTWLFGHFVVQLPPGVLGVSIGIAGLLVAWLISFGLVIGVVSLVERWLDPPHGDRCG
jgi:hypothetical protein